MFDAVLFFGLELTPDLHKELDRGNPHALKLFIDNQSEYLHRVTYQDRVYLGKFLDTVATLSALELVESNIDSLIQKLAPNFLPEETKLLFATKKES